MHVRSESNFIDGRTPLVLGGEDFHSITEIVARPIEEGMPTAWWAIFLSALGLLGLLGAAVGYLVWEGVGVWGLNNPVGWGWAIVNFVFWVGIGHAGTLISAVLFLFRQKWRTSINRAAEAMTIFAVVCALLFQSCLRCQHVTVTHYHDVTVQVSCTCSIFRSFSRH